MKIVADENIPLLRELFGSFGDVHTASGSEIGPGMLTDADALIVRSVTSVDESLLGESGVQFVGTATAGTNHVDIEYLQSRGITFAHAPASNADSVADYVVAALLELADRESVSLEGRVLGLVGVGAIGSRVLRRAAALGMEVVLNDPPRVEAEPSLPETGQGGAPFVDLNSLLSRADVVSLHVPLVVGRRHPTAKLIAHDELRAMKPTAWLINTARGEVVCGDALLHDVRSGGRRRVVLDVWEQEPLPDADLVRAVTFGTPHIAGYAWDGKVRGAVMVADALARDLEAPRPALEVLSRELISDDRVEQLFVEAGEAEQSRLLSLVRHVYDFRTDYERFGELSLLAEGERGRGFTAQRKHYPRRRELASFEVTLPAAISSVFASKVARAFGARP